MRILHLSSDPLPDPRVERAAWSGKRESHDVYFAGGPINSFHLGLNPFTQTSFLGWDARGTLHWGRTFREVRRRFTDFAKAVNPDLIHAHNVIAANLAQESRIAMVYDDHEYWSMWMKAELENWFSELLAHPRKTKASLTKRYAAWLWTRWESEIVPVTPTITVCEATARAHERNGGHGFVVPNMPSTLEINSIPPPRLKGAPLSTAIVGNDFSSRMKTRDSWGALDLFANNLFGELLLIGESRTISSRNVRSTGFVDHLAMLRELTLHHIGLIPWKPHWFHKFYSPNKAYEYMHAGLIPVFPSGLQQVVDYSRGMGYAFSNYEELRRILTSLSDNVSNLQESRNTIQEYARRELCWERFEKRIFEAYSQAR